jgi:hypothetical protein
MGPFLLYIYIIFLPALGLPAVPDEGGRGRESGRSKTYDDIFVWLFCSNNVYNI